MTRNRIGLALLLGVCALALLRPGMLPSRAAEPQRLLFTSNREGSPRLYFVDPASGATEALHVPQGSESLATWSPDGKQIAFCSSRSGNHDIWLMDADGGNVRQLTTDSAPDYVSTWSPDGKQLAFTTERTGDPEVFVMNADGSGQTNLTQHAEFDGDPAWSPDGKSILFASKREGLGFRLYRMDPDGKNIRPFPAKQTAGGPVFPAWSPDGKRIAYGDEDGAAIEIFTCEADGSKAKKLTALGGINVFPAWSPDGKQIAVYHYDDREARGVLWVVNVTDGVQVQLGSASTPPSLSSSARTSSAFTPARTSSRCTASLRGSRVAGSTSRPPAPATWKASASPRARS